ncbi:hypothetical protein OA868_00940 [Candidatus Pelagibacter sp.]|nr:hypothetical protein [Candidatus Pelagibacter sp.]
MNTFKILDEVNSSGKPYIIYKKPKGFDLFTNFSKKITLSNHNIHKFFKSISSNKKKIKKNDLYVGFFGYELLNNLIGIKFPKQKSNNFPKGIFYKPETTISLNENLYFKTLLKDKKSKKFKININKKNFQYV